MKPEPLRVLAVVDDATKLLMRALTPCAYKEIRPNLGMVRGTSSVVLRKTLFNSTYPLLVRAFKLRMSEFSPDLVADAQRQVPPALAPRSDPPRPPRFRVLENAGLGGCRHCGERVVDQVRGVREDREPIPISGDVHASEYRRGAAPAPGRRRRSHTPFSGEFACARSEAR